MPEDKREAKPPTFVKFDYDEYVLDINYNFVQLMGGQPVHVSFMSDTPEDEELLYDTLNQLNGFLFTGGNLTLVNSQTGETHPYYRTAKKVLDYCCKQYDERGIEFPVLGVC